MMIIIITNVDQLLIILQPIPITETVHYGIKGKNTHGGDSSVV